MTFENLSFGERAAACREGRREMMERIGTLVLDGRQVDVHRTPEGGIVGVGFDTNVEDWVLARAAEGGIAASRRSRLEAMARDRAIEEGVLKVKPLGVLGYTSEHVDLYTEQWCGGATYQMDHHIFTVRVTHTSVPVQGRGQCQMADVTFRLIPSAVRNGRLIIYQD